MPTYRLSTAVINRTRRKTKLVDGAGLFYWRNSDTSLTPWQRVSLPGGKSRDVRVMPPVRGDIDDEWLVHIRARAWALRGGKTSAGGQGGFKTVADAWGAYVASVTKWSDETRENYCARMERYVGGTSLWRRKPGDVTPDDVADAVAEARQDRPLLAPRLLLDVRKLFAWLLARSEVNENPAAIYIEALRHTERRARPERLPAVVDIATLRKILSTIETSNLSGSMRAALTLQAGTAQRSGVIAAAQWQEIDLESATWTIPRSKMKERDNDRPDHVVPLAPPVVALLRRLSRRSRWVFPSISNPAKPIAMPEIPRAMQRLGFDRQHTPHGWRSALKTLADDAADNEGRPLFAARWVEDVLDHRVAGVAGHYSRAATLAGMRRVLDWWGEQLRG